MNTGVNVGVGMCAHAGPVIMATENVEGFPLASMTGGDVVVAAVKDMAEKLGQGGDANAPEVVDTDKQVGRLKAEGVARVAEVDVDVFAGLGFGKGISVLELDALCVRGLPGSGA